MTSDKPQINYLYHVTFYDEERLGLLIYVYIQDGCFLTNVTVGYT